MCIISLAFTTKPFTTGINRYLVQIFKRNGDVKCISLPEHRTQDSSAYAAIYAGSHTVINKAAYKSSQPDLFYLVASCSPCRNCNQTSAAWYI